MRLALLEAVAVILTLGGDATAAGKGAKETTTKKGPTELEKALVEVAREGYTAYLEEVEVGKIIPSEEMFRWSRRWLDAQRTLSDKKADQVAAFKAHCDRMKEMEKRLKGFFDAGKIGVKDYKAGQYRYVQAQIWLARAQSQR
jgi:hypothetical protein